MTPHIEAPSGSFAPTCLLPGDPLRAEYIATDRNGVVSGLFKDLGFAAVPGTEPSGPSRWILNAAEYVAAPTFITRRTPQP